MGMSNACAQPSTWAVFDRLYDLKHWACLRMFGHICAVIEHLENARREFFPPLSHRSCVAAVAAGWLHIKVNSICVCVCVRRAARRFAARATTLRHHPPRFCVKNGPPAALVGQIGPGKLRDSSVWKCASTCLVCMYCTSRKHMLCATDAYVRMIGTCCWVDMLNF